MAASSWGKINEKKTRSPLHHRKESFFSQEKHVKGVESYSKMGKHQDRLEGTERRFKSSGSFGKEKKERQN